MKETCSMSSGRMRTGSGVGVNLSDSTSDRSHLISFNTNASLKGTNVFFPGRNIEEILVIGLAVDRKEIG